LLKQVFSESGDDIPVYDNPFRVRRNERDIFLRYIHSGGIQGNSSRRKISQVPYTRKSDRWS